MPLKITYFSGHSRETPACVGTEISSENLAITATSAQSGATPDGAKIVLITATEAGYYRYGPQFTKTPTAITGTDQYLQSGTERWIDAWPGYKIAAIT